MAIDYVGGVTNSANNGGDVTLDLAALTGGLASSPSEDDFVLVAYAIGDNDDVDFDMVMLTDGYTEVTDLFSNDTQDASLGVFYKFMGASPDASAQVDGQGGSDAAVGAVAMVFRGVAKVADGGPFDTTSTTATGIDTTQPDPPSIDWSSEGTWTVLAFGTSFIANGSHTFPTGYTTDALSVYRLDTTGVSAGMAYNSAPADPENPGVLTYSADRTSDAWCAVTMALKAAVEAAAGFTGWGIPI